MTDPGQPDQDTFTPTYDTYEEFELLEQAQANAQAAVIATVAWLQEQGLSTAAWAAGLGRRFNVAWGAAEPWEAGEFLDAMLTNLQALGAEVVWADLADPRVAAATVTNLFEEEQCLLFGTTRQDALTYLDATTDIARARGLIWEWQTDGDDVQLKVRGAETSSTG
jgi:hypothetical protein